MPSLQHISRCVCALSGLALVGCHSPYRQAPHNPYDPSYGGGVPMYSPQGAPLQPQVIPGSPTPVNPNGGFPPAGEPQLSPAPDPGSSQDPGGSFPSTNDGDSNGFSPSFDPSLPPPNGSGGGGGNNYVPDDGYGDPDNLPPTGGSSTFDSNSPSFQQDGAAFQPQPAQPVSHVQYQQAPQTGQLQLTAHQTASPPAVPANPNVFTESAPFAADPHPAKQPNPYGYDAVGYRWLRGVVDFDEQRRSWVLIYNMNPGPQDVYKGQLTLIDNGGLRKLRNNDVVLVEGHVDETARDPGTGKPQYRVHALHGPLVPKSPM